MGARSKLFRRPNAASKIVDRLMAQSATFTHRGDGQFDVQTGLQTYTGSPVAVMVRPWPLSVRERVELSRAGLTQVDTRWSMRCQYAETVAPNDLLKVGPFYFVVVPDGVSKDELGVEWTLYTRREET